MATRQVELTDAEVTLTRAALAVYARVKGAERMLEGQKAAKRSDQEGRETFARYDKLLGILGNVQTKLA